MPPQDSNRKSRLDQNRFINRLCSDYTSNRGDARVLNRSATLGRIAVNIRFRTATTRTGFQIRDFESCNQYCRFGKILDSIAAYRCRDYMASR